MVLETGKRLAARGHQVDCVCIRADRNIVGDAGGIRFHEIGGPLSSAVGFWLKFKTGCNRVVTAVDRILGNSHEDAVLFPQVFPANWWASALLRLHPSLPCVWYCQEPSAFIHSRNWIGALPRPKNWIARALNPMLRHMDLNHCRQFKKVLVNSQYSRQYTQQVYGYSDQQCEVVYLGVDRERFNTDIVESREPWITCIAKLTRFKNVDRIIDAVKLITDQGQADCQLQIVGTGDAEAELRRQVDQLGLDQHVRFHGRLSDSDMVTLLRKSRGLCLASVDEPFGLVAVEAMACGTPVIAVNRGGPSEIVGNTEAGLLIDRPEPVLIAKAMSKLLNMSNEFETRSSAALTRAADFDWGGTVGRLEAIFNRKACDDGSR